MTERSTRTGRTWRPKCPHGHRERAENRCSTTPPLAQSRRGHSPPGQRCDAGRAAGARAACGEEMLGRGPSSSNAPAPWAWPTGSLSGGMPHAGSIILHCSENTHAEQRRTRGATKYHTRREMRSDVHGAPSRERQRVTDHRVRSWDRMGDRSLGALFRRNRADNVQIPGRRKNCECRDFARARAKLCAAAHVSRVHRQAHHRARQRQR